MTQKVDKIVDSKVSELKDIFSDKYEIDYYQREYVWETKQIDDLINDLSTEFLKNWKINDELSDVKKYDPYFMGEIVLSKNGGVNSIIDGQQRITTFTLLLIYVLKKFGDLPNFPKADVEKMIYSDDFGTMKFNINLPEREECLTSLYKTGQYELKEEDSISVEHLHGRYMDIENNWNDRINDQNAVSFVYWLKEKVMFSKVWTNDDEFAYVIFETMNDRGLSLTHVEMLKSYILANIKEVDKRDRAKFDFEETIETLKSIKLASKSKAEFEFFKLFFRGHYANDKTQGTESDSDFTRIGKEFHRWARDNNDKLNLKTSDDYYNFVSKIKYYSQVYKKINDEISNRNVKEYLYLVVNSDYNFTLQPELILSSIKYNDDEETRNKKIKQVSKFITKLLTLKIWNGRSTAQNVMDVVIYDLCKKIRDKDCSEIGKILDAYQFEENGEYKGIPILNHQNKRKYKILISLITEVVARNSDGSDYMMNKEDVEVEHIWADHFENHMDEFNTKDEFANARNTIGDLLVLPKSFNGSYGDDPYEDKVKHYIEQNILAQTLNPLKYENNPKFIKLKDSAGLKFKSYEHFKYASILERTELYKEILIWNFKDNNEN